MNDPREFWEQLRIAKEQAQEIEEEHEYELEVLEESRPATVEDLAASPVKILAWLAVGGWWSASQVTRVFLPGKVFKTGDRAGESRPDKDMKNLFIHAANPDGRQADIWFIDGSLESALVRSLAKPAWTNLSTLKALLRFIEEGLE